jgi:hypothetical protein
MGCTDALSSHGKQHLRHLKNLARVPKNKVRIKTMATTTTNGLSIPASRAAVPTVHARSNRRRISPQAGRALLHFPSA